jgi:hypothetical protein
LGEIGRRCAPQNENGRRCAPQNKIENEVEVEDGRRCAPQNENECGCAAQKEVEVRNKLPTQTENSKLKTVNCKLAAKPRSGASRENSN